MQDGIPVLLDLLKSSKGKLKSDVLNLIVKTGVKEVVPALVDALEGADASFQMEIIWKFIYLDAEDAVPVLLKLLEDSATDSDVKELAVQALSDLGTKDAIPVLVGLLTDPDLNWVAARALADLEA